MDAIPWAALLVAVGTVVFGAQTPAPRPPLNGTLTDVEGVLVGHSVRRERPTGCTVVVVRDGESRVVVRRETIDDLLALDVADA